MAKSEIFSRTRRQISSFSANHPNLSSVTISLVLVVLLYTIYSILERFYPPKIIGDYIITIQFTELVAFATNKNMIPAVYGSLFFLFSSLSYLYRRSVTTFEGIRESLREPQEVIRQIEKLVFSRYRYLIAFVVGFVLLHGPVLIFWIINQQPSGILYLNLPLAIYMDVIYFLIAFLSALGLWLIIVTILSFKKIAAKQFKINIEYLNRWIDEDKIGGFKQLSDFSTRIFELLIFGILFFSPAAILYYANWYAIYFFGVITVGLIFLIATQSILHKGISNHRKQLYEFAKKKRESNGFTLVEYISILIAIKSIKDRPLDLSILWGTLISVIVFPILLWYVLLILKTIFGITLL